MLTRNLLAVALIGMAHAAGANDILGRPEYAPSGITRTVGYHDHARQDGTWSVEATSSGRERSGYASEMALYRSAEVANRQGHRFFQILRSEGTIGTGTMNRGVENVSLIVRFADSDAAPPDCMQRGRSPATCYTADVAKVMARLEPRIRDARARFDTAAAMRGDTSPILDHSGLVRFSTTFRFDVSERNAIENCTVAQSDAPPDLNVTACRIFTAMTHDQASRDETGNLVRSTRTARVLWQQSDLGGIISMVRLPDDPSGEVTASIRVTAPPPRALPATPPPALVKAAQELPSPSRSVTPAGAKPSPPVSSAHKAAAHDDTVIVPLE